MRFWLDTEFNDYRGELISLTLVAEDGKEFYCVLPCYEPTKWVAINVIPKLGQKVEFKYEAQARLQEFLQNFDSIHVIADWPEDIAHYCQLLITGPGNRLATPKMESFEITSVASTENSQIPHNALEDARALKRDYLAFELPK